MIGAVAIIDNNKIKGEIIVTKYKKGVKINALFTKLPKGKHGFHIHKAGDLRGEGCKGLCEHFDIGNHNHGADPSSKHERHTGDLGNIEIKSGHNYFKKVYFLNNITVQNLWGRSIIVHEDEDDLGKGTFEDSKSTGHSGARIGCGIFGRLLCSNTYTHTIKYNKVKKNNTKKRN
jgi:Cu-Zn family superoxide dismutase